MSLHGAATLFEKFLDDRDVVDVFGLFSERVAGSGDNGDLVDDSATVSEPFERVFVFQSAVANKNRYQEKWCSAEASEFAPGGASNLEDRSVDGSRSVKKSEII
jgi:hypothetical protein